MLFISNRVGDLLHRLFVERHFFHRIIKYIAGSEGLSYPRYLVETTSGFYVKRPAILLNTS